MRAIAGLKPEGGVALDIGANVGFWSVGLAWLAKGLEVHAFEPHPGNAERLRENLTLNGLRSRVHVNECGLSACEGTLRLVLREDFVTGGQTGNASISDGANDAGFATVAVSVRTLDSWVADSRLSRIDLMKIDVEGHEPAVLRGGEQTIRRFLPDIYLELNEPFYAARGEDLDRELGEPMLAWGYRAYRLAGGVIEGPVEMKSRQRPIDNFLFRAAKVGRG
jgi:FkbM family methyltransferase